MRFRSPSSLLAAGYLLMAHASAFAQSAPPNPSACPKAPQIETEAVYRDLFHKLRQQQKANEAQQAKTKADQAYGELKTQLAQNNLELNSRLGDVSRFQLNPRFPHNEKDMASLIGETMRLSSGDAWTGTDSLGDVDINHDNYVELGKRAQACLTEGQRLLGELESFRQKYAPCSFKASAYSQNALLQNYMDTLIRNEDLSKQGSQAIQTAMKECQKNKNLSDVQAGRVKQAGQNVAASTQNKAKASVSKPTVKSAPVKFADARAAYFEDQLRKQNAATQFMKAGDEAGSAFNSATQTEADAHQGLGRRLADEDSAAPSQASKARGASALDYVNSFK